MSLGPTSWTRSASGITRPFPGSTSLLGEGVAKNLLRFFDRYRRAWIDYQSAVKELIDAGDDVVIVVHETARARGTEMLVERDLHPVWTMRERRAIRLRVYRTKQEALEAVNVMKKGPPR